MRLLQELRGQKDVLVDEVNELHQQQKMFAETCCRRVDDLDESLTSLRDWFHRCPGPEELRGCVTWDVMRSVLLSDTGDLHQVRDRPWRWGGGGMWRQVCQTPLADSPLSCYISRPETTNHSTV
ncbi:unnamed protein product [Pleuronectes platessa]|uniref:Uncharacterized protein n=1 Tax=Pleuronectes platessa TaxID=8262 RepID=A0A9N7U4C3_PLEPL|nr:unnamed protein product [Pleuronectes platessa]